MTMLPITRPVSAPGASPSDGERRGVPLVLVGDNSPVVREVLRWHLESHGYQVVEAADGAETLVLAQRVKPCVILLSVELPTLNGHQTLARLKADADLRDTPVVFITAHTETGDVVEGLRLGAHDYLRKPFEPAEVIARVSAAVRVKELQDDLRHRNAELDRISRSDPLTGLANRRDIDEQLAAHAASAGRHHHQLSVALVDIDNFKGVNDTFGHGAGDAVLCEVARRIADSARVEDLVGRWGGEEFIVILPHCDVDGAVVVSERIRQAVSATAIRFDDGVAIPVTVSIGCTGGGDERLIERADAALYAAKKAGRDCTVALEPSTARP
jgi:two-component system cell cycle response regulator